MQKVFSLVIIFISITLVPFEGLGQKSTDIGLEIQVYPTGIIPGIRVEKNFDKNKSIHIRFGYNWIRHRDLGIHEDERGDGYGLSLGYKRYFSEGHSKWNIGIKTDVWKNSLDWKDNINLPNEINGMSDITVIQPTIELGYLVRKNDVIVTPSMAFGYEWNVKTSGEPTGDGAILLLGIIMGKRF